MLKDQLEQFFIEHGMDIQILLYKQIFNHRKKSDWLPNNKSKQCMLCKKSFSFILRRHHCRLCGLLYCDSCCPLMPEEYQSIGINRLCQLCQVGYKQGQNMLSPSLYTLEALQNKHLLALIQSPFDRSQQTEILRIICNNLRSDLAREQFFKYLTMEQIGTIVNLMFENTGILQSITQQVATCLFVNLTASAIPAFANLLQTQFQMADKIIQFCLSSNDFLSRNSVSQSYLTNYSLSNTQIEPPVIQKSQSQVIKQIFDKPNNEPTTLTDVIDDIQSTCLSIEGESDVLTTENETPKQLTYDTETAQGNIEVEYRHINLAMIHLLRNLSYNGNFTTDLESIIKVILLQFKQQQQYQLYALAILSNLIKTHGAEAILSVVNKVTQEDEYSIYGYQVNICISANIQNNAEDDLSFINLMLNIVSNRQLYLQQQIIRFLTFIFIYNQNKQLIEKIQNQFNIVKIITVWYNEIYEKGYDQLQTVITWSLYQILRHAYTVLDISSLDFITGDLILKVVNVISSRVPVQSRSAAGILYYVHLMDAKSVTSILNSSIYSSKALEIIKLHYKYTQYEDIRAHLSQIHNTLQKSFT